MRQEILFRFIYLFIKKKKLISAKCVLYRTYLLERDRDYDVNTIKSTCMGIVDNSQRGLLNLINVVLLLTDIYLHLTMKFGIDRYLKKKNETDYIRSVSFKI